MNPATIVFLTVFIDLIGFGIIIPLLPFYAQAFGASALTVGLLSTSFSFMQFVFAPIWGRLSDRVGRRPVILLGLAGSAMSYVLFGLAQSLVLLFAARIAGGIAGANIPTAQAYMADVTTPEDRARGMGMVGAAFGLGFIFGPAIGGFLSQWGYQAPSFFAAALSALNFGAAWFLLPESRPGSKGAQQSRAGALRAALARPGLGSLLLIYFIVITAFSSFEMNFSLYAGFRFGFDSTSIGYVFAFIGLVLAVVQGLLVGKVVPLVGERRVIAAAIGIIALGLLMVPLARGVTLLVAACGVLAVGMGFNSPSIAALISRLSRAADQGGVLGVSQSVASLARIIGPAWGGYLYDEFGRTTPFFSAAAMMGVAWLLSLIRPADEPPGDEAAPPPPRTPPVPFG